MALNKGRAARTARIAGSTRNTNKSPSVTWDKESSVDSYDGRSNLQAGTAGKEPGGRFGPAYYESGPKIITKWMVRDPSNRAGGDNVEKLPQVNKKTSKVIKK